MHGSIYGHQIRILIDNGATQNFLNFEVVKKLKLLETKNTHYHVAFTIQGDDHITWDTQIFIPLFFKNTQLFLTSRL